MYLFFCLHSVGVLNQFGSECRYFALCDIYLQFLYNFFSFRTNSYYFCVR